MSVKTSDIKSQFKSLDFIFIVLLSSQLLTVVTFYFLKTNNYLPLPEFDPVIIKIVIMILNISAFFLGKFFYNTLIKKIHIDELLEKKIFSFRTISLFRLTLIESVNLINVIAYLFTGDNSILLIFIIMFVLFFTLRPTTQLFIRDFNLSDEEKNSVLETL
ncbi:MAG: hypothetical protein F9K45_08200 [Melioribacteraceae bacterium]|nr:MAG: hypothetical protein F9K45_08200 [Melioribacteraceae bacterium]